MAKTTRSAFDGEVWRPEQPTDPQPRKVDEITFEGEVAPQEGPTDEEYRLTQIARLATDLAIPDIST